MKVTTRLLALAAAPLILLTAACLTADQISSLQKDVAAVRAEMEQMRAAEQKRQEEARELRSKLEGNATGDQERRADIELRLKALEDQLRTLSEKSEESAHRAENLSAELGALRSAPANRASPGPQAPAEPEVAPKGPGAGAAAGAGGAVAAEAAGGAPGAVAGAQEMFNAAYSDYSKGNYQLAIKGFEEFLGRYGNTNLADNARYWIGASYYDSGDYEHAVQEFDRLLADYPTGDRVPGAYLKKALATLQMNKTAQGVVLLQYLIEHYPNSDEARVARERLKSMGLRTD